MRVIRRDSRISRDAIIHGVSSIFVEYALVLIFLGANLANTTTLNFTTSSEAAQLPFIATQQDLSSSLAAAATKNEWENIEGCPDYNSFNASATAELELKKITCICGPSDSRTANEMMNAEEGISINCIYGSTLSDFNKTLSAVLAANRRVNKITLSGLLLDENGTYALDSIIGFAYDDTSDEIPLKSLEIKTCHSGGLPLQISTKNSTKPLRLPYLEQLTIEYCNLDEIPKELIQNSQKLRQLSLPNNKIRLVAVEDIRAASTTLEFLNLEGNLINQVENGALAQLTTLKTLRIGEHNFAASAFMNELGQIPQLELLDMTRMDGIDNEKNFTSKSLKTLVLTGCNFKSISAQNFENLSSLEEMDLRINLIERIRGFPKLDKLKRLNLAGNFLRSLNDTEAWAGLLSVKHLDLGWNDFLRINSTTFKSLNKEVEIIDLRHNENLRMIENDTFVGFEKLLFLNVSHSALNNLNNNTLTASHLKVVDLSFNNISSIDSGAFDSLKETVEYLNISGNQLSTIDANLLSGMAQLKELDISENPWICDESLKKVRDAINKMYKSAATNSKEFELKNEKTTVCYRPYAKRGISIFQLEEEDFVYDKTSDVTAPTTTTTTTTIDSEESAENATLDWRQATIHIGGSEGGGGEEGSLNSVISDASDAGKPTYDINTIRYGQRAYKKLSNTWLSAVIVAILILLTAICIILIVRRKKTKIVKNEIACTATSTQL